LFFRFISMILKPNFNLKEIYAQLE
jgi:hypothetical protein